MVENVLFCFPIFFWDFRWWFRTSWKFVSSLLMGTKRCIYRCIFCLFYENQTRMCQQNKIWNNMWTCNHKLEPNHCICFVFCVTCFYALSGMISTCLLQWKGRRWRPLHLWTWQFWTLRSSIHPKKKRPINLNNDYLYIIYTLFIHYLYIIYKIFIHYLYIIYTFFTIFIHYLYTIYTLLIHYL